MAMTKQFVKTQWNDDREPAITAEQLNRMEKGIDVNDTRIVELDKAVTANKTAGDKSLEEVNKTLQKHTEDITAVNNELTSQSKAIGELADKKITKFYASSQGDSTLSDSDDGKMQDMMLYGKSEQKQYSGKNLLNVTGETKTVRGITCTKNEDGTYTFSGTATDNAVFTIKSDIPVDGKTYRLVGCPKAMSLSTAYIDVSNNVNNASKDTGNGATISFTGEYTYTVIIVVMKGYTCNNLLFKPMLVDADKYPNATYDDFEPYVGGIPSPNPDYPQEIKSVVEPVVNVTGKNLLDLRSGKSGTGDGVTYTQNADGSYTMKGTATGISGNVWFLGGYYQQITDANTLFILEPGTYTIKDCVLFSSTVKFVSTITIHSRTSITGVRNPYMDTGSTYNTMIYPRVLAGNNDTGWEPYTAQSVPLTGITLNAIPVSSGGNVTIDGQQYISDYVDVERGKIVRMCKEIILNGSEGWIEENDNQVESHRMHNKISEKAISTGNANAKVGAMCSHFIEKTPVETWVKSQSAFSIQNGGALQFRKIGILTVVDWKSWLSENNITVYYPLATPTEESLSEELAEKLKALQTYYPQTNLFITSNQLDGYAIFNYPISLANGWNYVKQQIGDTRDYIYDMDLQMAHAYVNSEYAVALTELEV